MDSRVVLGIPFAVGVPDDVARKFLDALAAMGIGAASGPQGPGNVLIMVAQEVDLSVPNETLGLLQSAIDAATKPGGSLGAANPIPWPTGGTPAGITISNDGAYIFEGTQPAYANMCLSWVQDHLGLPHEYPSAIAAWSGYGSRGLAVGTPAEGDMVFFAAASVNGGYGHVGVVQSDGTFTSVWSNGNIMDAPIGRFASDNGAAVLGYISTSRLRGQIGQS